MKHNAIHERKQTSWRCRCPSTGELTTIESKVFMGMSWRQCLAAVILAIVCGGGYVGLWLGLGMDPNLAMYLIFPPGLPVAIWGWVRPKGLMPEKYLKYILRHYTQREVYLLDGPGRPYRTGAKPTIKEGEECSERRNPRSRRTKTMPKPGRRRGRKKATRLPKGVKQLIGYDAMLRNRIASLGDGRWSATILFQDINYQLSPESHQMEIIDRWAKLINSFEAGQNVQIASYTRSRGVREILADVMMGETGDSLDHYRLDYNRLAQGKLESVSRNTSTVKTLTVTVRESDEQAAVATLNALCNNLVSQMRSIDACKATRLDREHRLRLMAEVLRPGEEFRFDERRFEHQPGKPDTKDLVCPWSIDARNPIQLDIESLDSKYLHRTMWVSSLPPELSDQLVNDLTGLRARVDVSIHLAPMDRGEKHDARAPQERRGQDADRGPAAQEPQAGPRPRRPSRRPRRPAGTAWPAARRAALHQPEARGLDHRDRRVRGKPGGAGGRVQERESQGQRAVLHGREPQVHADGGTDGRAAAGQQPPAHEADP